MAATIHIELHPLSQTLTCPSGTSLQDLLFAQGVEFPCGGRGRCKGCRVRLLTGDLPVTSDDARLLSPTELADGWRLACRAKPIHSLNLELAQWEALILSDNASFNFTPRPGLGAAVDLGTTTIVAQLLDLGTGNVLAVRTALNVQARHGADIMSRIDFAVAGGQSTLEKSIREQIGQLLAELLAACPARAEELTDVVVVGNTVMHHLFCGISVEPLSHVPFEPENDGLQSFDAAQLGWWIGAPVCNRLSPIPPVCNRPSPSPLRNAMAAPAIPAKTSVRFLPCLGGFVGSDILAGVLATELDQSQSLVGLIDLGTNGEIVIGNHEKMLCASTAAGPAFEGARISMGMRAATGAISEVAWGDGKIHCRVLGNGPPRGICGSGLVDAVAVGLELGSIQTNGRLANNCTELRLESPVSLNQRDIRELQLAKGAIAAGVRILLGRLGAKTDDLTRLYLAGAFGNYISRASARRIGLLNFPPDKVDPAGNTALRGAKLALFQLAHSGGSHAQLRQRIQHVPLSEDEQFQDVFVEEMAFPGNGA